MDFTLTATQQAWMKNGARLGRAATSSSATGDIIAAAAGAGLLDTSADLLSVAAAVSAIAVEHPTAAVTLALHTTVLRTLASRSRDGGVASLEALDLTGLAEGRIVGALALSSDDRPVAEGGRLRGRASWVAPLTSTGIVVLGAVRRDTTDQRAVVCAALLSEARVATRPVDTAGLHGMACGEIEFDGAPCVPAGEARAIMASIRVLLAAAGLGMGRRALHEALEASRRYAKTGPGGEQTVHGLLADTATELDAATLLTWKAASSPAASLADASMAKLAATEATQRAVLRATQVVGASSFARGHPIERLAQDVRALELFAGRTEALREAIAEERLTAT